MTEHDWLTGTDWADHLRHVGGFAGPRKLRLLAAGFCRTAWRRFDLPDLRAAVAVAEQYADGHVPPAEVEHWRTRCRVVAVQASSAWEQVSPHDPAAGLAHWLRHHAAWAAAFSLTSPVPVERVGGELVDAGVREQTGDTGPFPKTRPEVVKRLKTEQDAVLRAVVWDVFGNPFAPRPFAPAWRTSEAVAIARGLYASGEFSAMPILADALQDAGCDDDAVLAHCRGDQTHFRGCWVVDAVLRKA